MKKFSIWKWFYKAKLDAYTYVVENKKAAIYKKHFYLWIFILASLISLASALMLSIFSSLKLAKLWIFSEGVKDSDETIKQLLDNYIYITNALNAIVAFISTLISFFSFKQGYLKNRVIYKKLDFELFQYENKIGYYANDDQNHNDSLLIDRASMILDVASKVNELNKNEIKEEYENEK